jgi:choline dehydrogenase-like flavoprotein
MIVDARLLEGDEIVRTDVCVVGAGPAGIALAREWVGKGFQVALVESGSLDRPSTRWQQDVATMSLSRGESVGFPYDRLEGARCRAFGGSSHAWRIEIGNGGLGARLHPLDPIDFEKRDWVPYSGWPFDRSHLDPYYERAQEFFDVGPASYEARDWEDPGDRPQLPFAGDRVRSTAFQFARSDVVWGRYRDDLLHAENVAVYVYANVTGLRTDEGARRVERARVACLPGGDFLFMPFEDGLHRVRVAPLPASRFWIEANYFVLAAGGTENPRLLLLSNDVQERGLGNDRGLVGRFFMEHPHLWSGWFIPANARVAGRTGLYGIHTVNGVPVMAKLTLSEDAIRRERLLNYGASILPVEHDPVPDGVHSLLRLGRAVRNGRRPRRLGRHIRNVATGWRDISRAACRKLTRTPPPRRSSCPVFRLDNMAEQAPNPDSRVTLADERDALGLRRVRLDWRLSSIDILSMARAQEILDEELRRSRLGHLQIDLDGDTPPKHLKGGWHHMGTTRMHTDPRQGVVDDQCRVHGLANLYVAGSSVFPTVGYANPMLTIIALAIRLADHLKARLRAHAADFAGVVAGRSR